MADNPGWIPFIQGLTTVLRGAVLPNPLTRRSVIKFCGVPARDDGTQTVVCDIQTITGSGSWDGECGMILVRGSGARVITLPDPAALAQHAGFTLTIVDADGNSGTGNITTSPATVTISANRNVRDIVWLAAGSWGAKV